jgi:hypothetical protein
MKETKKHTRYYKEISPNLFISKIPSQRRLFFQILFVKQGI